MVRRFFRTNGASGADTPFDNLVGLQTVTGGGLTQGNFEFDISLSEKNNRTFNIGVFGDPISLDVVGVVVGVWLGDGVSPCESDGVGVWVDVGIVTGKQIGRASCRERV